MKNENTGAIQDKQCSYLFSGYNIKTYNKTSIPLLRIALWL